jgi:hypothetical protein
MDGLKERLHESLDRLSPDADLALRKLYGRTARRHTRRRVVAGALALTIFISAGVALWLAFKPETRPASKAPSSVARVVCSENAIHVLTPTVQAQADGIRVWIHNEEQRSSATVYFEPSRGGEGRFGSGAAPGTTQVDPPTPIAPGRYVASCNYASGASHSSSISITDPRHLWHPSFELRCAPQVVSRQDRGFRPAFGSVASDDMTINHLEDFVRQVLGLKQTDLVTYSGYPEQDVHRSLEVTRNGRPAATVTVNSAAEDVFRPRVVYVHACDGSGIVANDVLNQHSIGG